jgi:hypothetical protein
METFHVRKERRDGGFVMGASVWVYTLMSLIPTVIVFDRLGLNHVRKSRTSCQRDSM